MLADDPDFAPHPSLKLALRTWIELGDPQVIGETADGLRRIVPILGGRFEGEGVEGDILPFGGDWQLVHRSGRIDLDARYTLHSDRGELLYVNNLGNRYIGPEAAAELFAGRPVDQSRARSHGYMRIETTAPRLSWMNERLFIPRGRRGRDNLLIAFYEVA